MEGNNRARAFHLGNAEDILQNRHKQIHMGNAHKFPGIRRTPFDQILDDEFCIILAPSLIIGILRFFDFCGYPAPNPACLLKTGHDAVEHIPVNRSDRADCNENGQNDLGFLLLSDPVLLYFVIECLTINIQFTGGLTDIPVVFIQNLFDMDLFHHFQ